MKNGNKASLKTNIIIGTSNYSTLADWQRTSNAGDKPTDAGGNTELGIAEE